MDHHRQLTLDRLLLQREEKLARVAAIERRIEEVLGRPYPLPEPPDLPSRRKPPRRPKARKKNMAKSAKPSFKEVKIRPLQEGETAYCLRYRWKGEEEVREEMLDDPALLGAFLSYPGEQAEVFRLETCRTDGQPGERLWNSPEEEEPPAG